MPDPKIEDHSAEMEHDLHKLEDHIGDAKQKLQTQKDASESVIEDAAGDWEGEQDRGGGDDPKGAADDAREGAPGGSQDGPGARGAGGDDDEREAAEVASPT